MRAFTDSFIVSNPGQKLHSQWTSPPPRVPSKTHFLRKNDCHSPKKAFFYIFTVQLVMSQLDGEVFPDFCGEKTKLGVLQNIN